MNDVTVIPPEMVKTDKTYFVANDEFLQAVFGSELADECPLLVSFTGNPTSVSSKLWFGRPWQGSFDIINELATDANNYFSLAIFKPDEAGRYRRLKSRFQALHAVMLDDVGSKVPLERLTLPPSWLLETSPGNCQAGYGDWSDLCRQPLLWLNCSDPAVSVFEAMSEDPDRETLGRLLTAWQSVFGKTPAMVRDAVKQAFASNDEHIDLHEVLRDIADERGEINRRKLGWWIKRHTGRIVDGRRFIRSSGNRSAEAWQVDVVESVSSVPILSSGKSVSAAKEDSNSPAIRGVQLSLLG